MKVMISNAKFSSYIRTLDLCHIIDNSYTGSYVPVIDHSKQIFKNLEEIELLNTRGAHVYTKLIHQLLDNATKLKHAKFQFVDTLNDEVLSGILSINPLFNLESFTLDQCHSISSFSLGKGRVQLKKNLEFSRFSGWVGLEKFIFQI